MEVVNEYEEHLSWKDYDDFCRDIARQVRGIIKQGDINAIFGLPRGGLVMAVRLSHLLGIPCFIDKTKIDSRTLVVDDIIDGAKTLGNYKFFLNEKDIFPKFAVLVYSDKSKMIPDFVVYKRKLDWLVFPYEVH